MVRRNLEAIPEFSPPPGFSIRWYQPADEEDWLRIHVGADQLNEITRELFQRQFGTDQALLISRQCYLVEGSGTPIGTGTAWFTDNFEGTRFGRIHWLAILPEFQGRGLAKPMMATLCHRLRELGHDRAYLTTAAVRLPAIKLYLRFGFAPLIRTEGDEGQWRGVMDSLRITCE
jgi:GNAT superfamily N-acetyltransferase